jgi:hypothetical protein
MLVASAGVGLVLAAPASAGCEIQPTVHYCDQPRRPDGSWDRCRLIVGFGVDGIGDHRDAELRCYPYDPTRAWFNGEPQHYIEP